MAAAFVTWHAEVSAAGMAYRMATVHATKRAYLLLGTCLLVSTVACAGHRKMKWAAPAAFCAAHADLCRNAPCPPGIPCLVEYDSMPYENGLLCCKNSYMY
jgi:hypothetical protein